MSTEYQQVPSQQAFYSAQNSDLDPWLISAASNMTISWGGKGSKRGYVHSPPMFEEDIRWSPPSTPTYKLAKKPVPSQYISTASTLDPWAVVHEPQEQEQDQDDSSSNSSPGDEETPSQNLYKTELCRSFVETGTCRYGAKCQFAHGKNELRTIVRHPKYKTEICKTFHTLGTCPYGTRCRFIHTRPKTEFGSVPSSPYTSPYASPPLTHAQSPRSPSPPSVVPGKWSTVWPTNNRAPLTLLDEPEEEEVEEDEEENDSEVPDSPAAKSRLAVFRTIC